MTHIIPIHHEVYTVEFLLNNGLAALKEGEPHYDPQQKIQAACVVAMVEELKKHVPLDKKVHGFCNEHLAQAVNGFGVCLFSFLNAIDICEGENTGA